MFSSIPLLFLCFSTTLAGSYAPPPLVQPSPSAYGSPYSNPQQAATYGYPQHQKIEDTIYQEPQANEDPVPNQTSQPPVPIKVPASQPVYEYPSTVYSDYDTTTPYPTTTTTYAPLTDASEDEEHYGVPEIPSSLPINPLPSVLPAQEALVVSQTAHQSYAPPPPVQAAPSAYGAPVASSSSDSNPHSYDQPQYNELQYTAGEVPPSVLVPGTPENLLTESFTPPRVLHRKKIRAHKTFHKKH